MINRIKESKRDSVFSNIYNEAEEKQYYNKMEKREKLDSDINTLTNNLNKMDIISANEKEDMMSYSSGLQHQSFLNKFDINYKKDDNLSPNFKYSPNLFIFNKEKIKLNLEADNLMKKKKKHRNSFIENKSKFAPNTPISNINATSNILKNYSDTAPLYLSTKSQNELLYDEDFLEEFLKDLTENKWEITEKMFAKYKDTFYGIVTTQVGSRLLQKALKFTKNEISKQIASEVILLFILINFDILSYYLKILFLVN